MTHLPLALTKLVQSEIAIWGLGREGLSSYRFLRAAFPNLHFYLYDDKAESELSPEWRDILAHDDQLVFSSSFAAPNGPQPTLIFKTPGIPLHHPLLTWIGEKNITTTSNTQLFLELVEPVKDQIMTIGVTGTKGKSTTCAVIHHLLETAGWSSWLAGNIGMPPLDIWPELTKSLLSQPSRQLYVVLELSAHQLHDMHLNPQIAVIQNIVPEHLDYYSSFESYVAAKGQIVRFQTADDYVIYNHDYPVPTQLARTSAGQHITFSSDELPGFLTSISLPGHHNLENIMPAITIGQLLQIPEAIMAHALSNFKPLPHRLELVGTVNGVAYYNDSLATVPDAALAALKTFADQRVVLIAGGFDRGVDYSQFGQKLAGMPLRGLILFPTTGEKIKAALLGMNSHPNFPIHNVETMPEAVKISANLAQSGDVVLMSPAAASFNTFKDYADRGNQFTAAVAALA